MVVSVGHDRTTFAVSDGKACQFTRVLDWGGASLNAGIARALDLAPSEAEPIKHSLSLADPSIPAGLTSEQAEKVREAVVQALHTFARELVSSLQFYQSQPGSLGIGEIVLTGGTAHLPGFADELGKLIGVRVRVGDPLANVKVGKKVDRERAARFVRGRDRPGNRELMRAVNLLPRDEDRARRQPEAVLLTAVLGAVLLTAVMCGWFMMASSGVSDKQAALDGAKAELLAIPPPEPPDTSQSTLVAEKDARLTCSAPRSGTGSRGIASSGRSRSCSRMTLARDHEHERPGSGGRRDPSATARPDACTACRRILDHRLHVLPRRRRAAPGPALRDPAPRGRQARLERRREPGQATDRQVRDQRRPAEGAGDVVTKQRIPKPAAIALVVAALLVVGALGYFVVISPKRSASADLAAQIEATETEIQNRRLAVRSTPRAEPIRAADLFRVTKAMPGKPDMPGVLLELNRIARDTGIRFDSITPGDSADAGGYVRQPIDVIFDGSFLSSPTSCTAFEHWSPCTTGGSARPDGSSR